MTEVFKTDASGVGLRLADHNGKLRSFLFTKECMEAVPTLPMKEDDILLCSYPKSGCHWLWEMTRMLLLGSTKECAEDNKLTYMFELLSKEDVIKKPSPRLWNTHLRFIDLPEDVMKLKNKIIFIYRNPKDVAVSFYYMHVTLYRHYKYDGKFNDYLELFKSGNVEWESYFDHMVDWDQAIKTHSASIPFHIVSYEDMQKNSIGEMRRLCQFLGKSYTDDFLEDVLDACTLDKMRERKGQMWEIPGGNNAMYRKGIVGDWKNYFSVARSEEMDRLMREKLSDVQFKIHC